MTNAGTGIYVRVSSVKQDQASQLPDLKKWVEYHPHEEVIWYRDKFTGKTLRRPGWSKINGYRSQAPAWLD